MFTSLLTPLFSSGTAQNLNPSDEASNTNKAECPHIEAPAANAKDVFEVPQVIGELTISKLFVHPIKVGLCCIAVLVDSVTHRRSLYPEIVIVCRVVEGLHFRK